MSAPPSGITPAASFELAGFEPQLDAPAIVADMIDPHTGDFASLTRSYSIADGMALFLLTVQRDSGAAVRGIGQRFREITHADEQSARAYEGFAREALQPAQQSGTLRLDTVKVEAEPDDPSQLNPTFQYIDLLKKSDSRDRNRTFTP